MSITFEPDAVTIEDDDGDSDIYDEAQVIIQWHTSLYLLRMFRRIITTVIFKHLRKPHEHKDLHIVCFLKIRHSLEVCSLFLVIFVYLYFIVRVFRSGHRGR